MAALGAHVRRGYLLWVGTVGKGLQVVVFLICMHAVNRLGLVHIFPQVDIWKNLLLCVGITITDLGRILDRYNR